MAQSTGINKIKIAVFFSGNGSNLKSLIKFSNKKKSPIFIEMIITDNPKAKGLKFGKIFKIKSKLVNYSKKNLAEKIIISELEKYNVKFICLAGFMKIISKKFIKRFKGKILNIHPSLLPKYKGLNTHERVIKNNEKFSGCTVHFVNSNLDSGKIILQKKVRINRKDTPKKLAKKILIQEHKLYPRAIMKVLSP
tara:strand:- start:516 stop:1097 length:582 start_codon:yes stop_codon:yes gene_type:complete